MMNRVVFLFLIMILLTSCGSQEKEKIAIVETTPKVYTEPSVLENEYANFNSPNAINKIAKIENTYFNDFFQGRISSYYGTIWREQLETNPEDTIYNWYEKNVIKQGGTPDSLHCTLYAYEGLKAGLSNEDFIELEKHHKRIWKDREIAGWSIGYILVKYMDWKAYLFLDSNSHEYDHCMRTFQKNKTYPVWKQPAIPLEDLYLIGEENQAIQTLLNQHEFSWGFSDQGYHTWITRFNVLKECNWAGSPANASYYFGTNTPLFIETPFSEYDDYQSHILVFPPKKN